MILHSCYMFDHILRSLLCHMDEFLYKFFHLQSVQILRYNHIWQLLHLSHTLVNIRRFLLDHMDEL